MASLIPQRAIQVVRFRGTSGPDELADSASNTPKPIGLISANLRSGISLMIGSGIFSTPASILRLVGTPSMALILWILGGIISYGGAMAFIELGLMYRKNGGTMRFLGHMRSQSRRRYLGTCFAWVMIVCIRPGAIAANGPVIGKYWLYAAGEDHNTGWNARGVGWGCITFVTALNIFSGQVVAAADQPVISRQDHCSSHHHHHWYRSLLLEASISKRTTTGLAGSGVLGLRWIYEPWYTHSVEAALNLSAILPWSIGGAVGIVSFLYIMANVAFFFVVPINVAISSEEILAAEFTYRVFGDNVGRIALPVFIGLSVLGAIASQTYGVSRLLDSANEVGFIPYGRKICGNNKRTGTPIASLVIIGAHGCSTAFAAVGAIVLRFRIPHHPLRTFKSFHPLNGLFILFCAFITVMPFVPPEGGDSGDPYPYYLSPLLGALTTLAGVVPWYFRMFWWADKTGEDYTQWIAEEERG
ncbi:hypothetical protein DL89DRAFT_282654 [Linderina pennispora]|uniref:Amino acid transporter n=1 Tax=Linderina pennispora TaxID=61395 RepID=A0A1Y1WCD7_9FUNG|nr:uncharacterized protein DL89DRAFT_282654 [Linderina pennispora]ORX71193.1 hypothetical protein DL89DRAFT_282654 [Linderina pennispora]